MRSNRPNEKILMRGLLLAALLVLIGRGEPGVQVESTPVNPVLTARVEAPITPVTAGFIERAIREADEADAACLVIELDTPGGLMESTRQIVKNILASPVPIVVYVSPRGARAASAGVFITLASHVAAMAPATHIGAAHPVQIGGAPGPSPQNEENDAEQQGGGIMEDKIVNDAKAWARSLAELRGRNADWAEAAVTQSESIPSTEALDLNVIDYLADDLIDLLDMIDSLEVQTQTGSVSLRTANAPVQAVEMWWGEKVLSILSDPNLAFLLLMLGFYGILFEFYTPGWGIAGTTGAICLVLAFFGLAVLPINYAGLVLIVLAVGLFVAEAFFPSFGMLTIGGAVCLILGGIMLVDSPMPVMRVSLAVVIPVAIGSGIVAFFLAGRAVQSFRLPIQTGAEAMVGRRGRASGDFAPRDGGFEGTVLIHGELWRAESDHEIVDQQAVTVEQCISLTLIVKGIGGSRTEGPAVNQDQ